MVIHLSRPSWCMCHNMYFYMHKHNMCNALCLLSNHTVLFLDTLHNYHTETFNFDFESFIYWLKLNQMILILSIPWNTGLWALFFIFRNYILVWMTSCVLLKFTKKTRKKKKRNCSLMLWQNIHNLCHLLWNLH